MCLFNGKAAKIYTGYKIGQIVENEDGTKSLNAFYGSTPFDKWVAAQFKAADFYECGQVKFAQNAYDYNIKPEWYFPGFHVFKYQCDAVAYLHDLPDSYKIFKCEYTGIVAQGVENDGRNSVELNYRTDVAALIRILPEPLKIRDRRKKDLT